MKWLIFLLTLFLPINAMATEYHVATDGSGDFTTIAQVEATVRSGDFVYLRKNDTWNEIFRCNSGVTYNAYGSGNLPQVNRLAIWDKNNISISNIKFILIDSAVNAIGRSQNIVIDNCDFALNNIAGHGLVTLGSSASWCDNIIIRNSIIYDGHLCCINFQNFTRNSQIINNIVYNANQEPCIQFYSSTEVGANYNITVKGNAVYGAKTLHGINIGYYSYNSIVEGNFVYSNKIAGISTDKWAHDNIIRNNICYDNVENLACYGNLSTINNKFLNNTSIGTNLTVQNLWFRNGIGTGNTYYNNILYGILDHWAQITFEGSAIATGDNNCFYNLETLKFTKNTTNYTTLASWQLATGQDLHSISADPLLNADYTLQAGSPCINAGVKNLGVDTDYNGVKRRGTPDIGAYEYVHVQPRNCLLRNCHLG